MFKCHSCGKIQESGTQPKLVTTKVYTATYPGKIVSGNINMDTKGKVHKEGHGTLIAKEEKICPTCAETYSITPKIIGSKKHIVSTYVDSDGIQRSDSKWINHEPVN